MTTAVVLKPFKGKRLGQVIQYLPGQKIPVKDPVKAAPLIREGFIKLILAPDSSGRPQAVKIWSEVVQDELWVVTHPDALVYVPDGAVVYLPEEIRNLRDATEEEVKAIHQVKKSVGGRLVQVKEREGRA